MGLFAIACSFVPEALSPRVRYTYFHARSGALPFPQVQKSTPENFMR